MIRFFASFRNENCETLLWQNAGVLEPYPPLIDGIIQGFLLIYSMLYNIGVLHKNTEYSIKKVCIQNAKKCAHKNATLHLFLLQRWNRFILGNARVFIIL